MEENQEVLFSNFFYVFRSRLKQMFLPVEREKENCGERKGERERSFFHPLLIFSCFFLSITHFSLFNSTKKNNKKSFTHSKQKYTLHLQWCLKICVFCLFHSLSLSFSRQFAPVTLFCIESSAFLALVLVCECLSVTKKLLHHALAGSNNLFMNFLYANTYNVLVFISFHFFEVFHFYENLFCFKLDVTFPWSHMEITSCLKCHIEREKKSFILTLSQSFLSFDEIFFSFRKK